MAINNAVKKAKDSSSVAKDVSRSDVGSRGANSRREHKASPLDGFQDRAATLRLYVKDKQLLKRAKLAALEDDTSLSQLWEDWATQWLDGRE